MSNLCLSYDLLHEARFALTTQQLKVKEVIPADILSRIFAGYPKIDTGCLGDRGSSVDETKTSWRGSNGGYPEVNRAISRSANRKQQTGLNKADTGQFPDVHNSTRWGLIKIDRKRTQYSCLVSRKIFRR